MMMTSPLGGTQYNCYIIISYNNIEIDRDYCNQSSSRYIPKGMSQPIRQVRSYPQVANLREDLQGARGGREGGKRGEEEVLIAVFCRDD